MLINRIKRALDTPFVPERVMTEIRCRLTDSPFDSESEFIGRAEESAFKIRKNPRYNMPAFVRVRNSWTPIFNGCPEIKADNSCLADHLSTNFVVKLAKALDKPKRLCYYISVATG